ncbi:MAG: hypothetical protein KJ905_02160 [Nanoarchaeota archaeon]|nr:hypothetical protein [Nanoarchaeota archaeon]MBU1501555.1 hypothetical protein [Nanoarchaeota archaeon]MBU2459142.1 hypothetical protein [Nanoarchaeota archaeon]
MANGKLPIRLEELSLGEKFVMSERKNFTGNEAADLISEAEILYERDLNKLGSDLSDLVCGKKKETGRELTKKDIYEIAALREVPKEYIERVIDLRHPSAEEHAKILNTLDAKLNARSILYIRKVLQVYEPVLVKSLQLRFPSENFGSSGYDDGTKTPHPYFEIYKTWSQKKESWFGMERKIKLRRILAQFNFISDVNMSIQRGTFDFKISLEDPQFVEGCGDVLNYLNGELKKQLGSIVHLEVEQNYI